jgi:hypothetical protein
MITTIQTHPGVPAGQQAEFSLPPDVIFVSVHDGSARLLNMAGCFHAVPAVGALMLRETLGRGAGAAVQRIAQEYGVEPRQVRKDLDDFLRELEDQGLLYSLGNPQPRRGTGVGLARLFLRPALHGIQRLCRAPELRARALLGLARISFRLFGWTRTIAVWKEAHGRFATRPAGEPEQKTIRALDQAVRSAAASHPFEVECKERALCCWSLARSVGLDAALVVGINLLPLAGHCWCEVGSQLLSDNQDHCADYTPVGRW